MNLIAIDIGNANVTIALYLNGVEESVRAIPGRDTDQIADFLKNSWEKVPFAKSAREKVRDGRIVISSVKPAWTKKITEMAKTKLGEKILVIGKDIPMPMNMAVREPEKVGTDRVVAAAAAYAVIEDAVIVADFGTAVTVDMVDETGMFLGGCIFPGFAASADALHRAAAKLPNVTVTIPAEPYGETTEEAINCGLFFSAVGALQEITRRYSEKIGKWPKTVITGGGAELIKNYIPFIDSYVTHLVTKGIALAYRRHLDEQIGSSAER